MTQGGNHLCSHCSLPIGIRSMERTLNGEECVFCCYGCCIAYQVKIGRTEEWDAAWLLIRFGVGAFLTMNIMLISLLLYGGTFKGADAWLLPWIHLLLWAFATPALVILGEPYFRETWIQARQGRLTASALVVLGVGAAYAYSVFATIEGSEQVYFDTATMVLMLFTLGSYIEAAGRAKAARDLEPLLAAESECATLADDGAETRRKVRDIAAGMVVKVKPGERVPVDGVVVEGESHADEAVITGESRQIAKGVGSSVIAGSMNLDGPLLIRCTGAGSATRWAQICRSVRDALSRRSPIQRLADRVVGISVPVVLILGALTAAYWAQTMPFDRALLIGLAVLVVACPCAVGLAAPLATSLGIGRLARSGCLLRDAGTLEALARARLIAFDKTGTLTSGRPRIVGIESGGAGTEEVLARAAGLERHSEHGLARAVTEAAAARGIAPIASGNIRAVPGRGIRGQTDGEPVAAGNGALMRDLGFTLAPDLAERAQSMEESGYSVIYVGWAGRVHAVMSLDDTLHPEARATVEVLRRLGLRVVLLTGDLAPAARRIAAMVGIEDVQAGLSPEAKLEALTRYRAKHEIVAMVGDGLNDGPVLAKADVGIAVGSATDLARETAALVLPKEGLWILPWAITVARKGWSTTLTNLMWAFGYNLIALALAMAGVLQPVLAAAVMASSSLLLVVNSLRLSQIPDPALPGSDRRAPDIEPDEIRRGLGVPAMVASASERR
jgi:Cu2+-exporting ATPase